MNIKQKVLKELEKKDFPDLKFLFSGEVLEIALELLKELLSQEKAKFEELLKTNDKDITFETFEDKDELGYFWHLLNHLQWVNRSDKIDNIIDSFEGEYIDFANDVSYSKRYFEMLEYCLKNSNLDIEQKRIISERIKLFKLRWIDLEENKQNKLKEISKKLSKLSQDFTSNIVKDQSKWSYHITDEEELKDLPEATAEAAKENAKKKKIDWYLFTADPTGRGDLVSYSHSEKTRKEISKVASSFATTWEFDNRWIVLEILKLKEQKAHILWYKNFAELSLETKMADTPEKVINLIEWISKKAKIKAKKELETLEKYFSLDEIKSSDLAYYSRIYKEKEYKIDSKEIKKYLEFENVLKYLHNLVWDLYWLELKQINLETYNEDVRVYEVYKDWKLISYYLLDAFYRSTKRPWAWADNLRSKDFLEQKIPFIINVCNFQKVKAWENLLSLSDAETLFHEFGHALHEILSESKYSELSWFNVEWDFVELPSQLHENWVRETESLRKLSSHYKTWESLSEEILKNLEKLDTYMSWVWVTRQNEFALLDMYLYSQDIPDTVEQLDKKTLDLSNKLGLFKRDSDYKMYAAFGHIFGWGYAAWYYSYMWAEIIEKDVWEEIKRNGIFDKQVATRFLNSILSQWSKKDAKDLFYDFMWREVNSEAFMKSKWLLD